MKKLFDKVGGRKREKEGSLVGKVVMVGQYSVRVEALVGEGGFATIYRCVDIKSGHAFALKHMRLGCESDAIRDVQHEAKTMARLKGHPNILKLHAVAFAGPPGSETDGFMLLDFCPLTLLELMTRQNFVLDDYLVYEVFQDVVWAVAHMHKCNPPLAHRDVKAENVLKNSEGRWVICDFGSSTARAKVYESPAEIAAEEEVIRRTTTPAYRAPEMWDLYTRQRIDTAVDVWALGVLLYVLAFGKLPFQGDSKLSILYGKYEMPPGRPPAMRSLIQDMLQVNPADRPDIFQVISKMDVLRAVLSSEPGVPPPVGNGPPAPQPPPQLPPPSSNIGAPPYQMYPTLPVYPQVPTTASLQPAVQTPAQPYHYNVQPYPYPGHPLSQQSSPLQQPLPPAAGHLSASGGGAAPHQSPLQAGLMRPPSTGNGASGVGSQALWSGGGPPPPAPLTALRPSGGAQTPRPQTHLLPPHLQPHGSPAPGQAPHLHPAAASGYPPPSGGPASPAPGSAAAAVAAAAAGSPAGAAMLQRVPSRRQQPLSPSDGGASASGGGAFQPPSWPAAALPPPIMVPSQPQTPQHAASQSQLLSTPQTPTSAFTAAAAVVPAPQQPLNLMDDETFPKAPATVLSANAAIEELLGGFVEAAVAVGMAPPAAAGAVGMALPPPSSILASLTVAHEGDSHIGSVSGTATPFEALVAGPGFPPLSHSPGLARQRHTGSAIEGAVVATRGLYGSQASGSSTPAGRRGSASMGFGDDNVDWSGQQPQPQPQLQPQQPELLLTQQIDWGEQPAFGPTPLQPQPMSAIVSGRDVVGGAVFMSEEPQQTPRRQEPTVAPPQLDLLCMDPTPPAQHVVAHPAVGAPAAASPALITTTVATIPLASTNFATAVIHPPPPVAVPAVATTALAATVPSTTVLHPVSTGPSRSSNGGDLSQLPLPSASRPPSFSRPPSRSSGGGSSGGSSAPAPSGSTPPKSISDPPTVVLGLPGPIQHLTPAAAPTTRGDEHGTAASVVQAPQVSQVPPMAPAAPSPPVGSVPQGDGEETVGTPRPLAVATPVGYQDGSGGPPVLRTQLDRLASGSAALEERVRELEQLVAAQSAALQQMAAELAAVKQQQLEQQQQQGLAQWVWGPGQQETTGGQMGARASATGVGEQLGRRHTRHGSDASGGGGGREERYSVGGTLGGGTISGTAAAVYGVEPWGSKLDEPPASSVAAYPPLRYEDLS